MGRKRRGPDLLTVGVTMTPDERVRFRLAVTHADVPAGTLVDRWAPNYLKRAGIRYGGTQPGTNDKEDGS